MRPSLRRPLLAASLFAAVSGLALFGGAPPAEALDEAEKTALHEEIRSFLRANPEVVIEALQAYDARQRAEAASLETKLLADNADALYFDKHSHVRGNPEGDVTLVEFLDYRCGFCKRAHSKILDIVEADGNIRYVIKEFPILGPQSVVAAKATLASIGLDEDKTSALQDLLMTHDGELDDASILDLAKQAGLDPAKLTPAMADPRIEDFITLNYRLARTLDINGTPAFAIGSTLLRGDLPAPDILAAIEQARKGKEPGVRAP
ncbi:DsbA family protein [Neomegalonema sp.]|uniref:DsbA family protein n=1 Tax=Neomegalonema sp. TaxID=2039713 RepID=UPI0026299407|nr:DsbA family protein [Neomegalonema sp.]MDD2868208.1 DsbA family protein [Neomegalonema sp.]